MALFVSLSTVSLMPKMPATLGSGKSVRRVASPSAGSDATRDAKAHRPRALLVARQAAGVARSVSALAVMEPPKNEPAKRAIHFEARRARVTQILGFPPH